MGGLFSGFHVSDFSAREGNNAANGDGVRDIGYSGQNGKGINKMKSEELKERRSWPLEKKIEYSLEKIWEFYNYHDGKTSVSYSGGKDSSVLLWLVRQQFPNVPGVFANTRTEYPEIFKFVRQTPNVKIVYSKWRFKDVIQNYGWPMVSKKVSRFVHDLQNPTERNKKTRILRKTGYTHDGKWLPKYALPKKWEFMVDSPFRFSDRCCVFVKEQTIRQVNTAAFVGTMTEDSQRVRIGSSA